jgi:hypothetical protein
MAVKHLVVLGVREAESSIDALHVPIDSVVLKTVAMAKSEGGLGVERAPLANGWPSMTIRPIWHMRRAFAGVLARASCPLFGSSPYRRGRCDRPMSASRDFAKMFIKPYAVHIRGKAKETHSCSDLLISKEIPNSAASSHQERTYDWSYQESRRPGFTVPVVIRLLVLVSTTHRLSSIW